MAANHAAGASLHWARRLGWGSPEAWRYFARYFTPHTRPLVFYSLAAAVTAASMVPTLVLVRLAIDTAIPQSDPVLLAWIGAGILAVRVGAAAGALVLRRFVVRLTKTTVAQMREELIEKLYRMERTTRTRADVDRLQNQVVQDTERLDVLVGSMLSGLLPAAFTAAALFVLLMVLSWSLVALASLAAPVVWLAARWTQRRVGRDVAAFQDDFGRFNRGVSFVLRQMELTRTQAFEREELARQQQVVRDLAASGVRMAWSYAVHGQLQGTVVGVLGIGLLVAGGLEVMNGLMTLGQFVSFYVGASMLSNSVLALTRGTADLVAAGVSLGTLAAIDSERVEAPYGGSTRIDFTGRLALRDVTFSYGGEAVLRGIDFDLAPGEHVAIVGPNGSGKTTLLNVLLGMLKPDSGLALADATPYAELDLEHFRRGIGVVMQRAAFFHGTIRDNIAYGHDGASDDAVAAAAQGAFADEFIRELPEGYDTLLGEAGITLSGGECQRLALARAVLRRPRLLVLDEPTNHLDAAVVGKILPALRQLPDSPAILVVSHDPRVIGFVRRSYHLRDGRLHQAAQPAAGPPPATSG
jgi:ABC-type bacteriocin/lantibiotic exporter with double-glycine peptidase domain